MSKEIEINGCIEVPNEVTNAFIDFIESKGWYFGGGFQEVTDNDDES